MFHELAFQIAKKAHSKQVDKAGKDYILHPMKVASYMDTDTEKAVAYLHDVLEDTNVTEDELRNMFPNIESLSCTSLAFDNLVLWVL